MKVLGKLLLTIIVLWLFSLVGWIDVAGEQLVADPVWNEILVLFILSLIIWLGMLIGTGLYMVFVIMTLGIGIFLLPFVLAGIGFFLFWFIQQVLPGWMFIDAGFWGTLLMSFVLGMIWLSNGSNDD